MYSKIVHCEQCGKPFRDDCGDSFCSSSCERKWEKENGYDDESEDDE